MVDYKEKLYNEMIQYNLIVITSYSIHYTKLYETLEKRKAHIPLANAIIEECGVPPTKVDLVLINGKSVDFNTLFHDGDRVSVYPVF